MDNKNVTVRGGEDGTDNDRKFWSNKRVYGFLGNLIAKLIKKSKLFQSRMPESRKGPVKHET